MEKIEFIPNGVCAKKMFIEIDNNIIKRFRVIGGCAGNSLGLGALIKDMPIDEAISRLSGIRCGIKSTSCPDQLAKALIKYKEKTKISNSLNY